MKLIAITDDQHSVEELAASIIQIKDLIDYIHIREKRKTASEIVALLQLLKAGDVSKEKIVINDRLDIALLNDIPNVHLPGHGLQTTIVKKCYPLLRVGRSVHSLEEAKQAERAGADYVLYGHCYETNCKQGKTPNGLGLLSKIAGELQIPVYAIGGIIPNRVDSVRNTGADGIAVMSGIFASREPEATVQNFFGKCKEEK